MNNSLTITIPRKLPLLEGLCWNVADPYQLNPKEMLDIYQSRWNYQNLTKLVSDEELTYIHRLTSYYEYPTLVIEKMSQSKQEFSKAAKAIIDDLDSNIFNQFNLLWGGGSLLSNELNNYRLSLDIDFIANEEDYDLFYDWMLDHKPQDLFNGNSNVTAGEVRRNRIGIRFPTKIENTTIKLEIIAEERFVLDIATPLPNQIPKLSPIDRIVCKLFANRDRWIDGSSYCRDLIDLAALRLQDTFDPCVFTKGKRNYKVKESLIEAIDRFKDKPELREKCYQVLQIEKPSYIIDGIDLLANDFGLSPVNREVNEINYDYLD